jgi:hypothetical protein
MTIKVINNGDNKPHTGQKETTIAVNARTLLPVATGIIFGQYTSQGRLFFWITGK